MTVQEFFAKWSGVGMNFDNAYGFQCVDLAQFYNRDVIGAPPLTGNAVDIWNSYPKNFYDRIVNTPDNFPVPGDIPIWNNKVGGGFGHIAVVQTADKDSFTSFDQNWPASFFIDDKGNQIGTGKAHFQAHTYTNVSGWLHPKAAVVTPPASNYEALFNQCRVDRDAHYSELQSAKATIDNLNAIINDKNRKIDDLTSRVGSLDGQLIIMTDRVNGLTEQAKLVPGLQTQLAECESMRIKWQEKEETYLRQIAQLKNYSYKDAKTSVLLSEVLSRVFSKK